MTSLASSIVPQTIKAGVLYFCGVFGMGFVLGPIRILWAVPRFGERTAELLEAPLMLLVIVLAVCRRPNPRFPETVAQRQKREHCQPADWLARLAAMALTA